MNKETAFKTGYCEYCAAFYNYEVLKKAEDVADLKDKTRKSDKPRFMCGMTLPNDKKHLCTVAHKYPEALKLWAESFNIIPGKFYDQVYDPFKGGG